MTPRTDCHRPSAIDLDAYDFVGVNYCRCDDPGQFAMLAAERRHIQEFQERTGARWVHPSNGGCAICGAACHYTAVFWHRERNELIRTGFDCAEKMHAGDAAKFRSFKAAAADWRDRKAGKQRAAGLLEEANLTAAWELYQLDGNTPALVERGLTNHAGSECPCQDFCTLRDIVERLVRYGSVSDKALDYLRALTERLGNRRQWLAAREAERAAAEDCPAGRVEIVGRVVKTEYLDDEWTQYPRQVMTVKDDRGFLVWGTMPAAIDAERGDRVRFTATVTPSERDAKFGFYKRPAKAEMLDSEPAAA